MPNTSINLDSLKLRIAIVIVGAVLVTVLLVTATWLFGDAIAESAALPEIAEFSKSMSPGNPKPHIVLSGMREPSFRPEDLKIALNEAEIAVSLSPYDFMSWQRLARLRERSGDFAGAEKALRRALELAPKYAAVQWALGNLLLRQDKNKEAFELIRAAVESDKTYAGPAASIAWDIFEGDIAKVRESIGQSGQVKAALAVYLSNQKRYRQAVEIWKSLTRLERQNAFKDEGKAVLAELTSGHRYLLATEVARDLALEGDVLPKVGSVTNGGFESRVGNDKPLFYEWLIGAGDVPSIGVSVKERRSGRKSLAMFFEWVMGNEFRDVSQTIALRGGQSYTLIARYKSSLKTDATVEWQIADTAGAGILASTEAIQPDSDWTSLEASFTVPEDSEGVVVRLIRAECAKLRCPISGKVWFDDIEVK